MEMPYSARSNWERDLLDLAFEPFVSERGDDASALAEGQRLSEQVTRANSKSFYLASGLLSAPKRRAVRVLYAFCRRTDDLVDEAKSDPAQEMAEWRSRALAPHPPADDALLYAWHDVRVRHRIPFVYVRQLVDGIAMDLTQPRYETFDDLARYCYGVASTVGLMAMHIIGFRNPSAIPYAVKLGVALQLTNILRDVGEDWRQGRVYLPQEDLRRFRYTEGDLERGIIDHRFRGLIEFEITRTMALYDEGWAGIRLLEPEGRLAIAAAAELYRGILGKIRQNGYDVFSRRAHLNAGEKLSRLPGLWWSVRGMG